MFIINDPGPWQLFVKRPDNIGLSIDEVSRKYLVESNKYSELLQELYQQSQSPNSNSPVSSGAGITPNAPTIPSNCIQFVNNTTDGRWSYIDFESSGPTNFEITWGDGQTTTDLVDGSISLEHEYAEDNKEYTCLLCFDDITLITNLDFIGDD